VLEAAAVGVPTRVQPGNLACIVVKPSERCRATKSAHCLLSSAATSARAMRFVDELPKARQTGAAPRLAEGSRLERRPSKICAGIQPHANVSRAAPAGISRSASAIARRRLHHATCPGGVDGVLSRENDPGDERQAKRVLGLDVAAAAAARSATAGSAAAPR
jgi:hypothetical protein